MVAKQAQTLALRGHEVTVFAAGSPSTIKKRGKNLYHVGIPWVTNPIRQSHQIGIALPGQIPWAFNRQKPDVIHIHSPGPIGLSSLNAAKELDIPVVATLHGRPEFLTSYTPWIPRVIADRFHDAAWQFASWFYNQADIVTAPSHFFANELRSHGITRPTLALPMWIDTPQDNFLQTFPKVTNRATSFLYFGRIDPDKNLEVLLLSTKILQKRFPRSHFTVTLAGAGTQLTVLRRLAMELGIRRRVQFTGFIKTSKISELYQAADVFVMPGLYETQSIVSLTAVSLGLPLLAAQSGALPEIAERFPHHCKLFDPMTDEDLADKMERMLVRPKRKIPPKNFQRHYGKDTSIQALEQIYLRVTRGVH